MNDRLLKRLILEELKKVLTEEEVNLASTQSALPKNTVPTRTSNTPELKDAVARASKDPKAFADFIHAQLNSRYIDDNESTAMVNIARSYDQYCKQSENNKGWCEWAIDHMNSDRIITMLKTQWKTYSDKQY